MRTRVLDGDDGRVWLEMLHGDEIDFFYSVRPRPHTPPAFAMRDTKKDRTEKLKLFDLLAGRSPLENLQPFPVWRISKKS
jgi:hypothetical protein